MWRRLRSRHARYSGTTRLLLALRTPEGRAAVLGKALDDSVAARGLAFFAFAVVDLERVLEIAELARGLAMVAQRRAAGLDRWFNPGVNRGTQPFGVIGRLATGNAFALSGFGGQGRGQSPRRQMRAKQRLADIDIAEPGDH